MYQGGNTAEQERQQRLRLRNERLDFENWAQPNGFDIERGEYGSYIYTPTYQVWQAWQARADMPERMGADRWADTLERLPMRWPELSAEDRAEMLEVRAKLAAE